jgi:putative membrane protein
MESTTNRNRNLWIALGILALLVLVALPAWGGGMMLFGRGVGFGAHPFVGFGAPWMLGFWGVGLLIRLFVWGVIVFLAVNLFRRFSAGWRTDDDRPLDALSPADILRRRYAAGEITREQYEEMKRTLEA